jgi:hypothetical protein
VAEVLREEVGSAHDLTIMVRADLHCCELRILDESRLARALHNAATMRFLLPILVVAVVACGETRDSDREASTHTADAGTDGTDGSVAALPPEAIVLPSVDAACGAHTGRALLARVKSPYHATFQTAAGKTSPLTLAVKLGDGEIRCHQPVSTGGALLDKAAQLELPVVMELATEDGLFAENLPARLRNSLTGSSLDLVARFPAAQIAGTFKPRPELGNELDIAGKVDENGTWGNIAQAHPGVVTPTMHVGSW